MNLFDIVVFMIVEFCQMLCYNDSTDEYEPY